MMGRPVLDFLVPLVFAASCAIAFQRLRSHFRVRRKTARLIE